VIRSPIAAALLALVSAPAAAQDLPALEIAGTRLDVTASGEVTRVTTPADALRQNGAQMARVRAALSAAGIADRDIQTLNLSLTPVYRNGDYDQRDVIAYRASNQLLIRFRQLGGAGPILDALVAQGVNEIAGPMLDFDDPAAALDEARTLAIRNARARADLYARTLGMRVKRVVYVSDDSGGRRLPVSGFANAQMNGASDTTIDAGGRRIEATVTVVFELE
jgi:uncharacterized protein YggE